MVAAKNDWTPTRQPTLKSCPMLSLYDRVQTTCAAGRVTRSRGRVHLLLREDRSDLEHNRIIRTRRAGNPTTAHGHRALAPSAHSVVMNCDGDDQWVGLPDGYWVAEPFSADLIVRSNDEERTSARSASERRTTGQPPRQGEGGHHCIPRLRSPARACREPSGSSEQGGQLRRGRDAVNSGRGTSVTRGDRRTRFAPGYTTPRCVKPRSSTAIRIDFVKRGAEERSTSMP